MSTTVDFRDDIRAAIADVLPDLEKVVREAVSAAMDERTLTVDQAAVVANCTPAALRKRIQRGHLRVVRHGRTVLVRYCDLLDKSQP